MKKQTQIPRLGGERGRALGPSDYVSANRIRISTAPMLVPVLMLSAQY